MDETEIINSLKLFAHKIKNSIHSVVINLDVLKIKLQKQIKDQPTLKHLDIATSEVNRLSGIIEKYLKYLELSDKERSKVNLRNMLN